jgi:hypothetical protein
LVLFEGSMIKQTRNIFVAYMNSLVVGPPYTISNTSPYAYVWDSSKCQREQLPGISRAPWRVEASLHTETFGQEALLQHAGVKLGRGMTMILRESNRTLR